MSEPEATSISDFRDKKSEESRFSRYSEYKHSDVDWLGKIPEHWDIAKLKGLLRLQYGDSLKTDEREEEGDVPVYGSNGVDDFHDTPNTKSPVVIVGRKGSYGKVNYSEDPIYAIDTTYYIDTETTEENLRWVYYLLTAMRLDSFSEDSAVPGLSRRYAEQFQVPDIPKSDQELISTFLDRETSKIDTLIGKKEMLIDLLEEKRIAFIKKVVTEGLDPNADMKNSGVEWVGKVPEHWNVPRIRFIARMESGHTPSKSEDEYWDGDIPWVSLADSGWMREHDYISETDKTISEAGLSNSSARILPPETMVFTRDATVGLCAITTREMAVSQHIIGWICEDNLIPEYLLNVTKSMDQELDRLTMGATISTVGMEDIKKLKMPLPPIEEQKEIVEHLNYELEKYNKSVEIIKEGIERLKEYKSALITNAVTGQIDVRGEV